MNLDLKRRWENPYKSVIDLLPGLLLPCRANEISVAEREYLRSRCATFSRVFVEGCSGSGTHLLSHAAQNPDALYVGFELRYKRAFRTAEKANRLGLSNVLVIRHEVQSVATLFPEGALQGIYLNFPDPWDRRRWQKHRVVSPAFVDVIVKLLAERGFFSYKTDHLERFQDAERFVQRTPGLTITFASAHLYSAGPPVGNITSEFEQLFQSKGQPICQLIAEKSSRPLERVMNFFPSRDRAKVV